MTNKGDLISREALKKAIDDAYKEYDGYAPEDLSRFAERVDEIIDNAPTVIPEKAKESELINAYTIGFDNGAEIARNERPQGEWVMDSDNIPVCKNCGEVALQRVYIRMPQFLEEVRMVKSNFCPNCGAKMQKGGVGNDT